MLWDGIDLSIDVGNTNDKSLHKVLGLLPEERLRQDERIFKINMLLILNHLRLSTALL